MDAAAVLKRKGAEAPEPWVPVPATKIRRLVRACIPLSLYLSFVVASGGWGC
jgi:hypothetical protein